MKLSEPLLPQRWNIHIWNIYISSRFTSVFEVNKPFVIYINLSRNHLVGSSFLNELSTEYLILSLEKKENMCFKVLRM